MKHPEDPLRIPQEADQVSARRIHTIVVISIVVALAAIATSTWIQLGTRSALGRPFRAAPGPIAPREIGLIDQTLFESDDYGAAVRTRQRQALERYGWADRAHGIAQIPIDRAMKIIVEQSEGDGTKQSGPRQ